MLFLDRIQKNLTTQAITDYEIQDLLPSEIQQEGTEVSASVLNTAFGEKISFSDIAIINATIPTYPGYKDYHEGAELDCQIGNITNITYPDGFNSQNSIILAINYQDTNTNRNFALSYGSNPFINGWDLKARFGTNNILMWAYYPEALTEEGVEYNVNVRLILMKIN